MSFQLTPFEFGLLSRLVVETPLKILNNLIEDSCHREDLENKIRKLVEDVVNVIYVTTQVITDSKPEEKGIEDQNLENQRESIKKEIVKEIQEILRQDILDELPSSCVITPPIRLIKIEMNYLSSIIDRYLKLLTGISSGTLVKSLDGVTFNVFKYLMNESYITVEKSNNFERVIDYIVNNINDIKHLYNVEPKHLFKLFDCAQKNNKVMKFIPNEDRYYVAKPNFNARPIISKLYDKHPIKYYSSLYICKHCKELHEGEGRCTRKLHNLEKEESVFLIPQSLLEDIDLGTILEALVYLRLRNNLGNRKSLITHNILIDNEEYNILNLWLYYTGSYTDCLEIELNTIDVIECKLTAEDKDVDKFTKKLSNETIGRLTKSKIEVNPYIVCIESKITKKENCNVVILDSWKEIDKIIV